MIQMRRSWSAAMAVTAALMTSGNALADTTATVATPAANASVANVPAASAYQKILDRTTVTYMGIYYGSSPGKLSDPVQPDEYGRTKENANNTPQELDNTLVTMYKITDNGLAAGLGLNGNFYAYGRGFEIVDPYLKVSKANLIKNGNFSYTADLRTYLPVSKASHNNDRLTRIRSFSTANYDIPNSKFSLLSYNDFNYYIYGSDGKANARDSLIAVQPTINYQAMAPLGVFLGYEMDTVHTKDKGITDWNASDTYLYLGASWDATSKLNISPSLAMRTGGAVNADSTQIQALFIYKLL